MYKQNPLGIYVYPHNVYYIKYYKTWSVNSILYNNQYNVRIINQLRYGIRINKEIKIK